MQVGITSPFAGVSATCVATFRIQLFMPLFSPFFKLIVMPFDSDVHENLFATVRFTGSCTILLLRNNSRKLKKTLDSNAEIYIS